MQTEHGRSHAEKVGARGEELFREYADATGLPYLWIDQRPETMPAYLRAMMRNGECEGKRPDAVAAGEDDAVLVDVKHYKLRGTRRPYFALGVSEAERLAATERQLGKRVLLAYRDNGNECGEWLGIYLADAMDPSTLREGENGLYYVIEIGKFRPVDDCLATDARALQGELFS